MSSLQSILNNEKFIPSEESPLTKEETVLAFNELSIKSKSIFRQAERDFVDPPISGQNIALFSFIPSAGATADKDGVYGFAKIRGTFQNVQESDQQAIKIIKTHDSVNKIYHAKVGHPFPITNENKFSAEINKVDLRENAISNITSNVEKQKEEDAIKVKELKEKEEALIKDSAPFDPNHKKTDDERLDEYIILRHKIAQHAYAIEEGNIRMAEIKKNLVIKYRECESFESTFPNVKNTYLSRFEKISKENGVDQAEDEMALKIKRYFRELPDLNEFV